MDPNATPAPPAPPAAPPAPEPEPQAGGGLTRDDIIAVFERMIPMQTQSMLAALAQHGQQQPGPEMAPEQAAAPPEPPPEGDEGAGDDLGEPMPEGPGEPGAEEVPEDFPDEGDFEDEFDDDDDEDPDLYCEEGAMSAPSGTNTSVPGAAKRRPRSDQYARNGNGNGRARPDRYAKLSRELEAERTARKKLEDEVESMRLDRYFRDRQDVFRDLARDYEFDPDEELESTATFSDEAFQHHVKERIPNRYQKRDPEALGDPDNVDFPAGAAPDRNARSGGPDRGAAPPLTPKQFSAVNRYAYDQGVDFRKAVKAVREERPELFG